MELPCASVVVTARNEERTVDNCIKALLEQDYPDYDILFVDAGSTDKTVGIVEAIAERRPNLRILQSSGTPSVCRNLAIKASDSPIIAFTDADVEVPHNWLRSLAETLLSTPDVGGVGGPNVPKRESGARMGRAVDVMLSSRLGSMQSAQSFDRNQLLEVKSVPCCNSAYTRSALLEIGGFDEKLVGCDDTDLGYRIRFSGKKILFQPEAKVLHLVRFSGLRQFASRMSKYGRGRGYAARRKHYLFSGPALPAMGLIVGLPLLFIAAALLRSVIPLLIFPLIYVLALTGYSFSVAISKKKATMVVFGPVILTTEYFAYSFGFFKGLLDRTPNRWSD